MNFPLLKADWTNPADVADECDCGECDECIAEAVAEEAQAAGWDWMPAWEEELLASAAAPVCDCCGAVATGEVLAGLHACSSAACRASLLVEVARDFAERDLTPLGALLAVSAVKACRLEGAMKSQA